MSITYNTVHSLTTEQKQFLNSLDFEIFNNTLPALLELYVNRLSLKSDNLTVNNILDKITDEVFELPQYYVDKNCRYSDEPNGKVAKVTALMNSLEKFVSEVPGLTTSTSRRQSTCSEVVIRDNSLIIQWVVTSHV